MEPINEKKGHPAGLYLLFFTEMWERFSYYGMRAILILFLTKHLMFDKAFAQNGIYGSFTGLVYLTPIIGGYVADRYWGNRKSIFVGGILMALGQFLLFFSGSLENQEMARLMLYFGLGFIVFGNGFFKPNISTMVGQLYPKGDRRIDSAFTIFYMGINLGAFFSPLICGYLGEEVDFKWGFLAAGIGMVISTISFEFFKNKYLVSPEGEQVGTKPATKVKGEPQTEASFSAMQYAILIGGSIVLWLLFYFVVGFDHIGSGIFALSIAIPASIILDKSLTAVERSRIWVIYIAAFFVIFFWSAFEQAGASLTFFADEQTNRNIGNWTMPASWFNSFNAIFIVAFAPLFSWLWAKLSKSNNEPSSPRKQAWGLLLLALGYVWIAWGVNGVAPGVKVSMMWLTVLYIIHTWGELCLSPIGLSMVNKLAPVRFASLLMGVWFLANACANKFTGILGAYYPEEQSVVTSYLLDKKDIKNADGTTWDWNTITVNSNAPEVSFAWNISDTIKSASSKKDDAADSLKSLTLMPSNGYLTMTDTFKAKRTFPGSLKKVVEKKLREKGLPNPKFIAKLMPDGKHLGVLAQEYDNNYKEINKLTIWNLYNPPKKFLGFEIANMYQFFNIFVVLAGIASIILFVISGKLQKMMQGAD